MKKVEYQDDGKEILSVHVFDLLTLKSAAFPIRIPLGVYIDIEKFESLVIEQPKVLFQYIEYEDSEMIRFFKEDPKEPIIYESEFKKYTEEEKIRYINRVISRLKKSKINSALSDDIDKIKISDLEGLPKIEYPMISIEEAEKVLQASAIVALTLAEEKQKIKSLRL